MELAFTELLHGKARSVAELKVFWFQVSHHGQAKSNGFNLNCEILQVNIYVKNYFSFLYVFYIYLYTYFYIYLHTYFSVKICLEEIVELLAEVLHVIFYIFTSLHSNSNHNS